MEQIKLIATDCLGVLEIKINAFLATLDDSTDIVDISIDSKYTDPEGLKIFADKLLATIRYVTYKIDEEPEEISETDNSAYINNGYPVSSLGQKIVFRDTIDKILITGNINTGDKNADKH